jgi:hypothetical protein
LQHIIVSRISIARAVRDRFGKFPEFKYCTARIEPATGGTANAAPAKALQIMTDDADPRDEIVRLETHIEKLADRLESCRKLILAGRVAVAAGGLVLVALLFGVIVFDPRVMMIGAAALLGGFVAWGSNSSTAMEAAEQMAAAESRRAALIGGLDLHVIAERRMLH